MERISRTSAEELMTESEKRDNHRADTLYLKSLVVFNKNINMLPLAFFFFLISWIFLKQQTGNKLIHLFVNSEQIVYYVDLYQ